ncbi:S8 family serine peptidase [Litchfieldia salsa]|uniref:Hydrophobic W protein n=1 Tax=Litchfieldia salsa TaxID=930152 RepID=A0A1H0SV80_9BACI|nr:S8 family serine peptidase [Litchfieldia salsa]SDP45604.1 hydrophobic W protein [Litchfieldia salsa]
MKHRLFLIALLSCLIITVSGYNPSFIDAEEVPTQEKEVIVVYKNQNGKDLIIKESQKVEYEFETIPAISVLATENEIEKMESNPNIDYVEENISFKISADKTFKVLNSIESASSTETQWNIKATNTEQAWNEGYTGNGVKVAVFDTGISNHSELIITGGVSTVDYTTSWQDDNGHGTHVSGIIAAKPEIANVNGLDITGVAPNVHLYAVKVLDGSGGGTLQDILQGLDWAIANDMDIINLSLGSPDYSQLFEDMINKVYEAGILIVAASGNTGLENSVHYPAKFSNVIAVSSVSEPLTISNFSSTGIEVEFSAPGENIVSTFNQGNYAIQNGTSQATPHVAGMLALLKEKYSNATNVELKTLLNSHSKDLGVTGHDPYYGLGLIHYNSNTNIVTNPSVSYSTHVQTYGWMDFVLDGKTSGTEGQSKRLEATKIQLKNSPYNGDIVYSTHVQTYGWLSQVANGKISGTVGESKRMEAIKINLTGDMALHYDVYYRVHSESFGWLGWAKNGEPSGTGGLSKRMEAMQVILVKKGEAAPGPTNQAFITKEASVTYSSHVQNLGWMKTVSNGSTGGTIGKSLRVEALRIALENATYSGGISYTTHVQTYGWLNPVSNGQISGTTGESKRVEAIKINLTGEMANHYDVYYRVHVQDFGWLDWTKNGGSAGTQGLSKRAEAYEIVLVKKGGVAPGSTATPFRK